MHHRNCTTPRQPPQPAESAYLHIGRVHHTHYGCQVHAQCGSGILIVAVYGLSVGEYSLIIIWWEGMLIVYLVRSGDPFLPNKAITWY